MDCLTWNKALANRIEVFQNHIMRFITGHKLIDKIRISTLRNTTTLPPLFDNVKSKCLKLFGHVKRSEVGLSKICFEAIWVRNLHLAEAATHDEPEVQIHE